MTKNKKEYTPAQLATLRKLRCEEDGLYSIRYFFKQRFGIKMIIAPHHRILWKTLLRVFSGEITRLIINMPPGYTKTEMAVIGFICWCLEKVPYAKFLHLSYGDTLVKENSEVIKDTILSDEFQSMWPLELKKDSKSKKKWWTEEKGGVYATASGGQVTGFRAGHMREGFSGATIIDDGLKADDALTTERIKINNRYGSTIKNRLAKESTPVILIGQRLHKNDLSGFLLKGGSGEKWHHLNLPVKIDNTKPYSPKYTHGIEVKHNLPNGWLWPEKHNASHEMGLRSSKRDWHCQYMQDPESYVMTGTLWTEDNIDQYRVYEIDSPIVKSCIAIDPSGDDGSEDSTADEIGIVTACLCENGHYYVFSDLTRNGSPEEWASTAVNFYHERSISIMVAEKNYGGAMVERCIRTVPNGKKVLFDMVNASRGKMIRAEPIAALYNQGLIHHYGHLTQLEDEITTYDGKGKSPNRLDALVWCLTMLSGGYVPAQSAPSVQM